MIFEIQSEIAPSGGYMQRMPSIDLDNGLFN